MNTFFSPFIITKCTDNVTKCKKALIDMNSCVKKIKQLYTLQQNSHTLSHKQFHQPSLKRMPSEPVLFARSDPARSTKCNFAHRYSSFILSFGLLSPGKTGLSLRICSRVMVKMACERLDKQKKINHVSLKLAVSTSASKVRIYLQSLQTRR